MADLDIVNAPGQESDGADLFLNHLTNWGKEADETRPSSPEKPEKAQPTHTAEETPEEPEVTEEDEETPSDAETEEETDGEGDDVGSEDEAEPEYIDDDTKYVRVKVGDEEEGWSLRDLKRLAGQESALTKKGQDLATQRTKLEDEQAVTTAAQNYLLDRARKAFEPYAKLDFLALSQRKDITPEQFQALREEAQTKWNDLQFLEQQARAYSQDIQQRQQTVFAEEAKQAIAQLESPDSPHHIEGWNRGLYDELRQFAVDRGVPAKMISSITNPAIIKLLHNAFLFDKGRAVKDVKTVKVNKSVKKVIKTSHAPAVSRQSVGDKAKFGDKDKAMAKLKRSGSMKNAEEAFMASFREFESE